jgi:hypothetical protein
MEKTKTPIVKAIFTNLLFVIGVILMVVGFVRGTSTFSKLAFFEIYPLPGYEESRCEFGYYMEPAVVKEDGTTAEQTAEAKAEQEKQKERCKQELERTRTVQKVEDVVSSVSFFVAGLALTIVFKQFIFQKK